MTDESIRSSTSERSSIAQLVAAGNINALKRYVESGGYVNATDDSTLKNPLIVLATRPRNKALLYYLIEQGADVNAVNGMGYSALSFCVIPLKSGGFGSPASDEVIIKLIESGADPYLPDFNNNTLIEHIGTEYNQERKALILKCYAKQKALNQVDGRALGARKQRQSL